MTHRAGTGSAFCRRYGLDRLVYAEPHATILEAIAREKAMKAWKRAWKVELIEQANPDSEICSSGWRDLSGRLGLGDPSLRWGNDLRHADGVPITRYVMPAKAGIAKLWLAQPERPQLALG